MSHKTIAVVLACFCLFAAMAAGVAYLIQDLPPTHEAARATMAAASPDTLLLSGTPPAADSQFGPITFGTAVQDGKLVEPVLSFPVGTTEVYATWAYQDMTDGTPYRLLWYRNDALYQEEALAWDEAVHGTEGAAYIASLSEGDGGSLLPGSYRLVLSIGEDQVQEAAFEIP